jgi:uncharacterized protein (TIGR04255 family)
MGTKMGSAPVYFTIAQARFNPILTLDTYAPQIQERLRKEGFPDVKKGFDNMERNSGFILDQGALSFQTTEYDVFESFSLLFLKGLQAVNEAVGLSFTERIGVRYLDAVFPKSGESLRDYLAGSVLGLTEKLDETIVHAFSETLVKKDSVNVRSRVIIQEGDVGFPPDLQPMTLSIGERFKQLHGRHAIIDTDGWSELREGFNVERVREQLTLIHTGIDRTFRASVTENALKAWG